MSFLRCLVSIVLILTSTTFALNKSRIFKVTSQGVGPYDLQTDFINKNSIKITTDSTIQLPYWKYNSYDKALYFSSPLDSGTEFIASYTRNYIGLKEEYSYSYKKNDNNRRYKKKIIYSESNIENDSIKISGNKSIKFLTSSTGESSIEQSLDVVLYGKIDDSISLQGHISDESTSLEGETKEVSEIDKIFLSLKAPNWDISVGDYSDSTLLNGVIKEQSLGKGAKANYKKENFNLSGSIGLSGYETGVNEFVGVAGVQGGIYNLYGETGGRLWVKEGSITVILNGIKLTLGTQYNIDNNNSIIFTPRQPIRFGDIISATFLYRENEFTKQSIITKSNFSLFDSTLNISSALSIIGEAPSEDMSREQIDLYSKSGDIAPEIGSGVKVNSNDAVLRSAKEQLYSFKNEEYHWESNIENIYRDIDLFVLTFTVNDTGEYLPYSKDQRFKFSSYSENYLDSVENRLLERDIGSIYLIADNDFGLYSATKNVSLPEKNSSGEISINYNNQKYINSSLTIGGRNFDKNSLSEIDDNDNLSSAIKSKNYITTDTSHNFGVNSSIEFMRFGDYFQEVLDNYTISQIWGVDTNKTDNFQIFEGSLGSWYSSLLKFDVSYGESFINDKKYSKKINTSLFYSPTSLFNSRFSLFIRDNVHSINSGNRASIISTLNYKDINVILSLKEQWFQKNRSLKEGFFEKGLDIDILDINLNNSITHRSYFAGVDEIYNSTKQSDEYVWQQSFSSISSGKYRFNLENSLLYQKSDSIDQTIFLLSYRENRALFYDIFNSSLTVSVSSEQASQKRWEYYPAIPKGSGTHIRDSTTGQFILSNSGDYYAKEIKLWSSSPKEVIHNSLSWNWRTEFNDKNILKGLLLNGRATLDEEFYSNDTGLTLGWIPLYRTINIGNDSLRYSYLRYQTGWEWMPQKIEDLISNGNYSFIRRVDLTQRIIEHRFKPEISYYLYFFTLGLNLETIKEDLESITINRITTDNSFLLSQSFDIYDFTLTFSEKYGILERDSKRGNYWSISPILNYYLNNIGNFRVSYSYGNVEFPEKISYPMADGMSLNKNHIISSYGNIKIGKYTSFIINFRARYNEVDKWNIYGSLEGKVLF